MHFRDIRDILGNLLTFWFFATPIIYPMTQTRRRRQQAAPEPEPVHALAISYQEILFYPGPVRPLAVAARARRARRSCFFLFGYFLFDRLRDSFAEEV